MNILNKFAKVLLISSFTFIGVLKCQYLSHFTLKGKILQDTILDKCNGDRFILDMNRDSIIAMDNFGKVIWRTNPVKDAKLEDYRTKNPKIVQFYFDTLQTENKFEVIRIVYDNTQFGYLLKSSGKFIFLGQN